MSNLRRIADTVKARTGFRSVTVELVRDDAPPPVRAEAVARVRELITLQHELTRKPVVVVPVLVASGQISRQKLPRDIEGLPIVYSGEARCRMRAWRAGWRRGSSSSIPPPERG